MEYPISLDNSFITVWVIISDYPNYETKSMDTHSHFAPYRGIIVFTLFK